MDRSTAADNVAILKGGTYRAEVTTGGVVTVYTEDGTKIGSAVIASNADTISVTITATYLANTAADAAITLSIEEKSAVAGLATDAGTITINVLAQGEGISVMNQADAEKAITKIQSALDRVSSQRANLGAVQNRLEHTINNLGTSSENLTAAESRIRDVDMAEEMMEFTKNNIISQAATAMLAQANSMPQQVLQLLQ